MPLASLSVANRCTKRPFATSASIPTFKISPCCRRAPPILKTWSTLVSGRSSIVAELEAAGLAVGAKHDVVNQPRATHECGDCHQRATANFSGCFQCFWIDDLQIIRAHRRLF